MAEIKDLDPTDGNNTSIGGINSQGNTVPSNMDNILRAVAGMLARMNDGTAPLEDTFTLADPADPTKKFRFDGGGITASNTRVVTIPDADVTLPNQSLGTSDSPQFAGVNVGHASDTTLTRASAGVLAVEGVNLLRAYQNLDDVSSAATAFSNIKQAASDTATGVVELATDAETLTGTDTARAITPANLAARTATETRTGVVELATTAEVVTGTDTARAVTPAGVAAKTFVDAMAWLIPAPADGDYRVVVKVPFGGTITEVVTRSTSGTCTLTVKVNTTALGGTANSVSTSEQAQAHASTNTFATDDDIVLTVSSNSSCLKMSVTIKYTRALG